MVGCDQEATTPSCGAGRMVRKKKEVIDTSTPSLGPDRVLYFGLATGKYKSGENMKTKPLKTAGRGMQVFIRHFDDDLTEPGSLKSRGLMVDVLKTGETGFDLWVMNGRIEGHHDFESREVKLVNRMHLPLKGRCFEVLGVSRDEYDYWRMENSLRDNPESVIMRNDGGTMKAEGVAAYQSEMDRLEAEARTMALRNLQRWNNPIYSDGTDKALENLTGLIRKGLKLNCTPSLVTLVRVSENRYRADFDWIPPGQKPRGFGNTRTDAIIDLYQETMSKPCWTAAYTQEIRKINADECAPEIQEKHLQLMDFIDKLDLDALNRTLSGLRNKPHAKDIPEESGPTP